MSASQPVVMSFCPQARGRRRFVLSGPHQIGSSQCRGRRISDSSCPVAPLRKNLLALLVLGLLVGACVPAHAQVIQTIAGGVNPSHSPSENACVPLQSVAAHGTDVYFAGCAQIFKVNAQGQYTHVAGTGINAFSPDGTAAASANFDNIASLSLDSAGNIYFNEAFSNRVREIVASTG